MRHRVFVSSTFNDLRDHRTVVQDAIRQLGAIDVSMEHFGARDARPHRECIRVVSQESDSFVGIYAHRYGHVPQGSRKSITEAEFDAAAAAKLPRFVYLVDEEAPWNPKYIDSGHPGKCLERFKRRLMSELIVKPFATRDQLATSVAADLGRHLATQQLTRVQPGTPSKSKAALATAEEWSKLRDGIYSANHDLFLVHALSPSQTPGQLFDIFIYVRKHKASDTPEVAVAEFFLGKSWGNRVFRVVNQGGLIGLATSAYGEFLCVCRITLKDGNQLMLERYIDFGATTQPGELNRSLWVPNLLQQIRDATVSTATPSVDIFDINALAPLHPGFEMFRDLLHKGGRFRIMMLDPLSTAFVERSRLERDGVGRIATEQLASFHIIGDLIAHTRPAKRRNLELRLSSTLPDSAMVLVNARARSGLVLANPYPTIPDTRGLATFWYTYTRADAVMYDGYRRKFEKLWADSQKISVGNLTPPTEWPFRRI